MLPDPDVREPFDKRLHRWRHKVAKRFKGIDRFGRTRWRRRRHDRAHPDRREKQATETGYGVAYARKRKS